MNYENMKAKRDLFQGVQQQHRQVRRQRQQQQNRKPKTEIQLRFEIRVQYLRNGRNNAQYSNSRLYEYFSYRTHVIYGRSNPQAKQAHTHTHTRTLSPNK